MSRLQPKISTIKTLVALSGNECAFKGCSTPLVQEDVFIGDLAHIAAAEEGGPRYDPNMNNEQRRSINNLMLLCPTHHKLIDKPQAIAKYTVKLLTGYKNFHEAKYKDKPFEVSEGLMDEVYDSVTVTQLNYLHNGVQNNVQNIYHSASDAALALEEAMDETVANTPSDGEGIIDRIAQAEEVMPLWSQDIVDFDSEIRKLTPILNNGVRSLNRSDSMKKGLSGRINVFRQIAGQLRSVASQSEVIGDNYSQHFAILNTGILAIFDLIDLQPERKGEYKDFLSNVSTLTRSALEANEQVRGMLDSMEPLEKMSTDLRRQLAKIRKGLNETVKGAEQMGEWQKKIDDLYG